MSTDFQRMAVILFESDKPEPFIDDLSQHLDEEIV
jgi:hypothetical protein